jgi:hypothetical protein
MPAIKIKFMRNVFSIERKNESEFKTISIHV